MPEFDGPRAAFDNLRREVLPAIKRPGVEATRRTVQRRRTRHALLGCLILVLLVVGGMVLWQNRERSQPTEHLTSPTPAPTIVESPAPTATPSAINSGFGAGMPARPGTSHSAACARRAFAQPSYSGGSVTVRRQPLSFAERTAVCPDVRVSFDWWIYTIDEHWTARVIKSGTYALDQQTPTLSTGKGAPPECGWLYVVRYPLRPDSSPAPATLDESDGMFMHGRTTAVQVNNLLIVGPGIDKQACAVKQPAPSASASP